LRLVFWEMKERQLPLKSLWRKETM
jgi:hypothetical protein